MRVYIISDFHLGFDRSDYSQKQMRKAVSFIEGIRGKADMLILNGDIFDFWMEWKNAIIGTYFPVLKALADLRETGCRLVFIAGNHDFWFRDFLPRELGMEIYQDSFREDIDGKKIFVSHGDSYTASDFRYHFYRSIIRFPLMKHIASFFHPNFALWIVKRISRSSRRIERTEEHVELMETEGLVKSASNILKKYDIVCFAHSHIPRVTKLENGVYANSGDWIINNSYLSLIDGEVQLHFWKEEST